MTKQPEAMALQAISGLEESYLEQRGKRKGGLEVRVTMVEEEEEEGGHKQQSDERGRASPRQPNSAAQYSELCGAGSDSGGDGRCHWLLPALLELLSTY